LTSEKKRIAVFGSTGSIGTQALEVIAAHPDKFEVEVLTAQNNAALLIDQARKFQPNTVVISNDEHYLTVKEALQGEDIKVFAGENALASVAQMETIDLVLRIKTNH
jgi:1-deoxy-D-xylulose-5-phosphate reductoisomerase